MILEDYRSQFRNQLASLYSQEEAKAITSLAFQFVLKMDRVGISLSRKQELSPSQQEALQEVLERLLEAEPIDYVIGTAPFYGLEFKINKATLIPRPETEELVAWILAEITEKSKILDIGTGSGCIAVSLAKHLPTATVTAIDVSLGALEIAKSNADCNGVAVHFLEQNILQADSLPVTYDVIVSNPPYVRELEKAEINDNVLKHEPHTALFVADNDPLIFYKKITELALIHLNPGGKLFFEINEYLGVETVALVQDLGFSNVMLKKDAFGKDRMIRAIKD